MDAINKLLTHSFEEERYHSDGFGHIQVQNTAQCDFDCSPADLLAQIDQASQWPEFLVAAKEMPDSWLIALSNHLPFDKHYSTDLLLELLQIVKSRDSAIVLIQESPRWYWSSNNISQINKVIEKASGLIAATSTDDLSSEIERSILQDIQQRLTHIQRLNSSS